MGYICPSCGEGLPDDEMCPCIAADDDLLPGRSARKRLQDQRRYDQMRANGPVERFTMAEIGERDGWLCGICRDTAHPVDPARRRPDPLSPSIDHIVPINGGGTHTRSNVQITHWFCNLEKNADPAPFPVTLPRSCGGGCMGPRSRPGSGSSSTGHRTHHDASCAC